MSVLIDWGDSDEIILLWQFAQSWTWVDARLALQQSQHLVDGATQTVILMIDLSFISTNSKSLLRYLSELYQQLPQEISRVILVDTDSIYYSMFQMLKFQHPDVIDKFCLVDSLEGGYDALQVFTELAI